MSLQAPALVCLLTLTACSVLPGGEPPTGTPAPSSSGPGVPALDLGEDHVLLAFDGPDPLTADSRPSVAGVRREGDAPLSTTRSGDGTQGLAFPAYAAVDERRLVLVVTPGPALSRSDDLEFGADVELVDPASGAADDGDNVLQRGLYADQDQLKLQVDRGVPSCTVRTPRMRAFTSLGHELGTGWFRLACRYDGATLGLVATPFVGGEAARVESSTPAPAGALSFPTSTPISVGGKVTSAGALVETQPDQFNGVLDNVYVSSAT